MNFEMEITERSLRADELVRQGRAQLRQVVLDAHRRGLSQRRIAALTSRSQPEVGRDGGGLLAARTMARTPIDFSRLGIWLDASAFHTA